MQIQCPADRQKILEQSQDEFASAFPLDAYSAWLDAMVDRGVEFITYDDLFAQNEDRNWESGYRDEYISWKKRCNPDKIYVLLQHDVDFVPGYTRRMVVIEDDRGITSNIFLFNELAGGYPDDSPYDDTPYDVDHEFFMEAEQKGFVIGYHQNVVPRCSGTMNSATNLFDEDVKKLKANYKINYFCPHGGRGADLDGVAKHNFDVELPESLHGNIRWVYNRFGLRYAARWSDGGIRRMTDPVKLDALDLLHGFSNSMKPGNRYFVLIHPQLWGWNVDQSYNQHLSARPWYKKLLDKYDL